MFAFQALKPDGTPKHSLPTRSETKRRATPTYTFDVYADTQVWDTGIKRGCLVHHRDVIERVERNNHRGLCINVVSSNNFAEDCKIGALHVNNYGSRCTIMYVYGDNMNQECFIYDLKGNNYGKDCDFEYIRGKNYATGCRLKGVPLVAEESPLHTPSLLPPPPQEEQSQQQQQRRTLVNPQAVHSELMNSSWKARPDIVYRYPDNFWESPALLASAASNMPERVRVTRPMGVSEFWQAELETRPERGEPTIQIPVHDDHDDCDLMEVDGEEGGPKEVFRFPRTEQTVAVVVPTRNVTPLPISHVPVSVPPTGATHVSITDSVTSKKKMEKTTATQPEKTCLICYDDDSSKVTFKLVCSRVDAQGDKISKMCRRPTTETKGEGGGSNSSSSNAKDLVLCDLNYCGACVEKLTECPQCRTRDFDIVMSIVKMKKK